ncbi:MAG: beta-glucuronidase [Bacteroidales bacterium]|nr:beta-glucuronidase [Bacteroidales bacterium]
MIKHSSLKAVFAAALLSLSVSLSAEEVPLVGNIYGRNTVSLNGEWNYIVDVQEEGYYDYRMNPMPGGFFINAKPRTPKDLIEYDFDKSPSMTIPSDWNTKDEKLFFYEGTVWFKKSFNFTPKPGRRTLLYFGAVNYEAHVWVNGKKAGYHKGGFTAFNMDVTDLLKDGENFVIVKVDNKRHAEDVPTQIFDWWNYGGITRDVMLVDVSPVYVENYSLKLDRENYSLIHFKANLSKAEKGKTITLSIPELKIEKTFTTAEDGSIEADLSAKPVLWCPENPKLYDVRITLEGESVSDKIGFRSITTSGKKILLNGKQVYLKGISIHDEKPYGGGRANSPEDAAILLGWAKELGCNFVRLAHYPHNEYTVREAEKMGIMVWSEIPVYWTIAWTNPDTYENARCQLRDMIARDQNRANVIIWSIANETPHSPERDTFLGSLATYARTCDDSRLISMAMEVTSASNYHNRLQDNMNKYVDVISFNEYIGWYRDVDDAPKMTWEVPYEKPVIISEFGGGARYGRHGSKDERWTEEFQENLYIQNTAMLDKIDGLSGTTPWILKDFRSPRRVLPDVQDYYNRKGLVSDDGHKKKAFFIMQKWYESK